MVYTNPIGPTETDEQSEDDIIAAVISDNLEPLPEDVHLRHGYELLPQEPEIPDYLEQNNLINRGINEDDNSFSIQDNDPHNNVLSPVTFAQDEIIREVWSNPSSSDIQMDSDKVEEVKQVMVNITLPPSAIPEWASNVPEDEWKEYLFNKLHIKQK